MTDRKCSTCACFITAPVPGESRLQGMCRRFAPTAQRVRISVPVMKDGKPVMQKFDPTKPLTQEVTQLGYLYELTEADLVCFDGWRPLGSKPGNAAVDTFLDAVSEALNEAASSTAPVDYLGLWNRMVAKYRAPADSPVVTPPETPAPAEPLSLEPAAPQEGTPTEAPAPGSIFQ